jgi:hypothetical protein
MATSKPSQDNTAIPYHKRIAMGEKLDGTSMQPKGSSQPQPKGSLPTKKNK